QLEQPRAAGNDGNVATAPATEPSAEVQQLRATTRDAIGSLAALGVPLGGTPERLQAAGLEATSPIFVPYPRVLTCPERATPAIGWLVLGGLLVGLGAPFWRDVVLSLTDLRSAAAKGPDATAQPAIANDRMTAATNRFLIASRARAVETGDAAANVD